MSLDNESVLSAANALKLRAESIRDRLLELQCIFDSQLLDRYQWPDILEQFSVLSSQCSSLSKEIDPILEHFVSFPSAIDQALPNQVPELLATKALPEMEEEEKKQIEEYVSLLVSQDKENEILENRIKFMNERIQERDNLCNALCDQLYKSFLEEEEEEDVDKVTSKSLSISTVSAPIINLETNQNS